MASDSIASAQSGGQNAIRLAVTGSIDLDRLKEVMQEVTSITIPGRRLFTVRVGVEVPLAYLNIDLPPELNSAAAVESLLSRIKEILAEEEITRLPPEEG